MIRCPPGATPYSSIPPRSTIRCMPPASDVGHLSDADIRDRIHAGRRCPLCRDDRRPAGTLCWDHHDELGRILDPDYHGQRDLDRAASIPRLWERLDPTRTVHGIAHRRAPGFESSPPCNLDVIVMRDPRSREYPVMEVWYEPLLPGISNRPNWATPHYEDDSAPRAVEKSIASLADAWWEPLGYHTYWATLGWSPLPPTRSVEQHCRWLHTHLDQLTAADDADDTFRDLAELHLQLRHAAGDPPAKPVADCTGWVRDPDTREKIECGAPLYLPPTRPGVQIDPSKPVLRCGRCDRPYTHLMLLRQEIVAGRKAS